MLPGEFAPDGKVWFGVRQTRFGVKTSTPTPLGDLKTHFEFELFGTGVDAGQTTFRLRQAYGELGAFGAGQTWSPFMDIDVFPNSLEYWGPNGMVFFRNVQVRWMPLRGERTRITIAAERPGASGDQGIYSDRVELQGIKPISMPLTFPETSDSSATGATCRWRAFSERSAGSIPTRINSNLNSTVYGWGVNVSSNVKLGQK